MGNRELARNRWRLYHAYFGSFISEEELMKADQELLKMRQNLEQYKKEHKVGDELKYSEYNAEQFKIIQENFNSLELRLAEL